MRKLMTAIAVAALLGFTLCAQEAAPFAPLLKKVAIDGQVLFEAGKTVNQTLEVDSAKPVDVEYTFVNQGDKATASEGMVFVHLEGGGKPVGADFAPGTPTSGWKKGEDVVHVCKLYLNEMGLAGRTVTMNLGIYLPKEGGQRVKLANPETGNDQRLSVGKIAIK